MLTINHYSNSFFFYENVNATETELVITFAVFKKSTIFDVNTSLIQYANYNCSNLNNKQIISDVISVSSNIPIKADSNFVKTLFRPHRVIIIYVENFF